MSNALVLIEDKWLSNVFSINLTLYAGIDSIIKHDLSNLDGLDSFKDVIDLIIIDEYVKEQNSYDELINLFGEELVKDLPLIVTKPRKSEEEKNFNRHLHCTILDSLSIPKLLKATARALDITSTEMYSKPVPNRYPLDIKYFEVFDKSPFQIFKKHRLDGQEAMYELVFDKGDEISISALNALKKSSNRKLFITSSERLKFANSFTLSSFEKFEEVNNDETKYKFLEIGRDAIFSQLNDGGSIESVSELADKCIVETIKEMDNLQLKDFSDYINKLLESDNSYFLQHSLLTTYVSFSIIDKLNWNSLSQKKTLSSAAFLKTILFNLDQEELAKVRSDYSLESMFQRNEISQEELLLIERHALTTSTLMSDTEISFFPENTHTIIRQHHGNRKGIGFKRDPESALHTMSIIFIVANDYADTILIDGVKDHNKILKHLTAEHLNETKYNQYLALLKNDDEDAA
jgi:phage replication-related protein YjqB (UPF0714/DUF867 family)